MFWFNVFKSDPDAVALVVNTYYADLPFDNERDRVNGMRSVLQYDLAWSGNTTQALLVAMIPAQLGSQWAHNQGYVYAGEGTYTTGQRPIQDPLPWRWCLNVKLSGFPNKRAYHRYHYAVSREAIDWNFKGDCVLKLTQAEIDEQNGRFGPLGGLWTQWLHFGTGSAEPGNPLAFVKATESRLNGVSVVDAARRRQGLWLQSAVSWQKEIVSGCVAGSFAYRDQMGERGLEKQDFIDVRIRDRTQDIMGLVLKLSKTFEENQKNGQGNMMNGGQGWRVRYGATGEVLAGTYQQLDAKFQADMQRLQKYQPVTDVSGEPYFHLADAQEWYDAADDWFGYLAQFAMFDFLCVAQDDPADNTRVDNYTPLYPDLPLHVHGLPKPQKNPQRKHVPGGLLL